MTNTNVRKIQMRFVFFQFKLKEKESVFIKAKLRHVSSLLHWSSFLVLAYKIL